MTQSSDIPTPKGPLISSHETAVPNQDAATEATQSLWASIRESLRGRIATTPLGRSADLSAARDTHGPRDDHGERVCSR